MCLRRTGSDKVRRTALIAHKGRSGKVYVIGRRSVATTTLDFELLGNSWQIAWRTPPGAGLQGRCAPDVVSDHAGESRCDTLDL